MKYIAAVPILLVIWAICFVVQIAMLAVAIPLAFLLIDNVSDLFFPMRMAADLTEKMFT